MPQSIRRFCSYESIKRKESIAGSAVKVSCFLLIEYYGKWPNDTNKLVQLSKIEGVVGNEIALFIRICPEPVRVLFIKKDKESSAKKIYLVRTEGAFMGGRRFEFEDYRNLHSYDLMNAYCQPSNINDIVLVCTHGKKDKCCAKFGYPVYIQLKNSLKGVADVWQCSHVGGDRFAANVLWLPFGLGFGHAHLSADQLAESIIDNRIFLKYLRGRCSFTNAAQYIEYICRIKWNYYKNTQVELISHSEKMMSNGCILASLKIQFKLVDGPTYVKAKVEVSRSEIKKPVLMSCTKETYGYPLSFNVLELDIRKIC